MRRYLGVLAAAGLACAIGLVIAAGAGAAAQPPKKDVATGDGVRAASDTGNPTVPFSFSANSGPNGENPSGTFSFDVTGVATFSGHITCLHVIGNEAVIGGVMDSGSGVEAGPGGDFLTVVWDNGKTKAGLSPDRMSFVTWGLTNGGLYPPGGPTAAQVCADPTLFFGSPLAQFTLLSGNINVKDAS
jgi:hypothetical protein